MICWKVYLASLTPANVIKPPFVITRRLDSTFGFTIRWQSVMSVPLMYLRYFGIWYYSLAAYVMFLSPYTLIYGCYLLPVKVTFLWNASLVLLLLACLPLNVICLHPLTCTQFIHYADSISASLPSCILLRCYVMRIFRANPDSYGLYRICPHTVSYWSVKGARSPPVTCLLTLWAEYCDRVSTVLAITLSELSYTSSLQA